MKVFLLHSNDEIDTEIIETDNDNDEKMIKCQALLAEYQYKYLLTEYQYEYLLEKRKFIKHSLSFTCGINQTCRNCFISAPLQIFARINPKLIKSGNYIKYFEMMWSSDISIEIEPDLIQEIREAYPGEESASYTVDFFIHDFGLDELNQQYYIKYLNSTTKEINIKNFCIKTAINTSEIDANPIKGIQIGNNNTEESIIDFIPPPIIFIDLWRYKDSIIQNIDFDPFSINVNDLDLQYCCIWVIIHTFDHFKAISFGNNRIMLFDDGIVADITPETDQITKKLNCRICKLIQLYWYIKFKMTN